MNFIRLAIGGFHEGLAGQVSSWLPSVIPNAEIVCYVSPFEDLPVVDNLLAESRASKSFQFPFGGKYRQLPVVSGGDWLSALISLGVTHFVCTLPDPDDREKAIELLLGTGIKILTLIHPTAVVLNGANIGIGSIIEPLAYIGMDVELGQGCHIHAGAHVDHNSVLEKFVTLNPKAVVAGNVKIGMKSCINISASVSNSITLGERTIVGAASLVLRSYPLPGLRLLGSPAIPK
jgi:hypothetical protein